MNDSIKREQSKFTCSAKRENYRQSGKQVSAMNKWCTRPWIHFALCITFLMTAIILCNWQEWSAELKMIATFMYAGFTFYSVMEGEVPTGITVGTIGFCALEVFIHTMFGIQMYQRFHVKGKQTIYGPGSITAYFGFGVFGVILCYQMVGRTITVTDWIVAALVVFVGVGIVCMLGPETIIKKRDNDYAFPSAGYFERFLK